MLYLTEEDVHELLPVGECVDALERAFAALAAGRARNLPRQRLRTPESTLQTMSAALLDEGVFGFKYYTAWRGAARFRVELFDLATCDPVARIQAKRLGQVRTGAASGLATRHLARADAAVLAVIGTGSQAETQLEAVAAVRKLRDVRVFSRDRRRREAFADRTKERLRLPVRPCATAAEAVDGADVVCTITTSRLPVFPGAELAPGAHVNAAGSNALDRREVDDDTLRRASRIVVDSRAQASLECGDLLPAVERGRLAWEELDELGDVVGGRAPGRREGDDVTLFESLGIALEDVAAAALLLRRARAAGRGVEIDPDAA